MLVCTVMSFGLSQLSTLLQLLLSAIFLKLHPLPLQHTPSYENSVIFGGVSLGCLLGLRFQQHTLKLVALSETKLLSTGWGLAMLARRLVIGKKYIIRSKILLTCRHYITWSYVQALYSPSEDSHVLITTNIKRDEPVQKLPAQSLSDRIAKIQTG